MLLTTTQLLVNGGLMLALLLIVAVMMRLGARYDYNYGISEVQDPIKKTTVYLIMAIIVIGTIGAAYNLFVAFS